MLQLIPEDHINQLEAERSAKLNAVIQNYDESLDRSWKVKECWLAIFAKSLSPQIACQQADVSMEQYRRWRATDPRFCRNLNRIMSESHDELCGSAYARATGYFQKDPNTESGYQEDATGRPIRYGQSDRLAIALLQPGQLARSKPSVTINIDFSKMGVEGPPPNNGTKAQVIPLPGVVIEAED